MPDETAFNEAYARLNKEQKRAVDAIEGPVMVIAGPGTGKTQILTLRIANILKKTDVGPLSILALTFTESGVVSMRNRLRDLIGQDAYRVPIYTFHGFCNTIIEEYPDAFPSIIGGVAIDDIEKVSLLKSIIDEGRFVHLKPFGNPYYYLSAVRSKISELKRENISPEKLREVVKKEREAFEAVDDLYYEKGAHKGKMKGKYIEQKKGLEKNEGLVHIYEAYQNALIENHRYDYEDMVMVVVRAFKEDAELLLSVQERFQYILADEHQDANQAQNTLLELLASFHENPNLFVVGDEKQAIFRFQGASLENFLYFKDRYKDALLVTLTANYRSTQKILDAAHSMIARDDVPGADLRVPLESQSAAKGTFIDTAVLSNEEKEYAYIAETVGAYIKEGVPPHEIAILVRRNKDAHPVAETLSKYGISFVIESDQDILADRRVGQYVALLKTVLNFGDSAYLAPTLYFDFLGFDTLELFKLFGYAKKERMSLYDIIASKDTLKAAGIKDAEQYIALYKQLSEWKRISKNKALAVVLESVLHESGLLKYVLASEEAQDTLGKIQGFFGDATARAGRDASYSLSDLLSHLEDAQEHGVAIARRVRTNTPSSVRIMTAHRSKGLEFGRVVIAGGTDRIWGTKKHPEHFKIKLSSLEDSSSDDDERRLFYVALTRAKEHVVITYAKENTDGREQLPSRFIDEIDETLRGVADVTSFEDAYQSAPLITKKTKRHLLPLKEKEFLNALFLEQGLSVTALNNFIASPWQYFFGNLLRVPKAQTKHLLFGTAADRALKQFFEELKDGVVPKERLLELFKNAAYRQPFGGNDLDEALIKGEKALSGYFDTYSDSLHKNTINGMPIVVTLPLDNPDVPLITLRGELDKVEILNEKSVRVVDYKTGKPKTRNDIEGKTKSSNGNYKRQLLFYKLLLDLHEDGKYNMEEGIIDFVEPDTKGKYRRESFIIEESEVEGLKGIIVDTVEQIINLSFWDMECDPEVCEFCDLVSYIKGRGT